jgi:hypothetical protein
MSAQRWVPPRRWLWIALPALPAVAKAQFPAAGQTSAPAFGVNVASDLGVTRTADMNFSWVRIYFPDQVEGAKRSGLRILLLVGCDRALTGLASWVREVHDLVSRYRGRIDAYQICNEPNLAEMWHRPQIAQPGEHVTFLREAYSQAKAADPSCTVVAAGLAVNGGASARAMDDLQFLRGMYAAGAQPYFDVLGAHPYGFGHAHEDATSNPTLCFRRVEQYRTVMPQYGDVAKPIWATRVRWIAEPPPSRLDGGGCDGWWWQRVSTQQQADYLVRAFQYAQTNWPWMGAMLVWNMDNNLVPWNPFCDPKGWFAFLNHDSRPGPAYEALARLAQGSATPVATPSQKPIDTPSPTIPSGDDPGLGTVIGRVSVAGRTSHQGVEVTVHGRTTASLPDGSYRFEGIPEGTHALQSRYAGYLSHTTMVSR